MARIETATDRRARRNRFKLRKAANGKFRLSVHRTNSQIYAQIIDDAKGVTVATASTLDKELKGKLKASSNIDAATKVGELIAKRAKDAKATDVVFDRGSFLYHGRVKALADAARTAGLKF